MTWHDSWSDKGYRGVVDVIAVPDPRYALLSLQRSSELVVHDLETGKATQQVSLGVRNSNPKLRLRQPGKEVWASDYDTVVIVDTKDWRVVRRKKLQSPVFGTGQFIGEYSFSPDGSCWVARPYSGDVIAVDDQLKIRRAAKVGRQPYEAIELPNDDVIARDWQTGDLLRGRMEPVSWLAAWFQ